MSWKRKLRDIIIVTVLIYVIARFAMLEADVQNLPRFPIFLLSAMAWAMFIGTTLGKMDD